MTQQSLQPSQRVREAAASLIEWQQTATKEWSGEAWQFFHEKLPQGIREGVWDNHDYVQAFARFERSILSEHDAADEIEHLRAENARLREATRLLDELRGNIGAASLARNPVGISIRDRVDTFLRTLTSTEKEG